MHQRLYMKVLNKNVGVYKCKLTHEWISGFADGEGCAQRLAAIAGLCMSQGLSSTSAYACNQACDSRC